MASVLHQSMSGHKMQLAATAMASGAVVAGVIFSYQRLQKKPRLKASPPPNPLVTTADDDEAVQTAALARRARAGDFDDELVLEQLARTRAFLGDAGLAAVRDAFVVVVGCGGVGSHAVAALARSGVGRVRLVDFDQVTLSSLNRHAVATLADVGTPKVRCVAARLAAVAPWVLFDCRADMLDAESASCLLGPWSDGSGGDEEGKAHKMADFVVDAIDNIDTKVELLKYCVDNKLPVISAMGAGTKSDPTRVMVGDIGHSIEDRLSRATRRRLKLRGVTSGIPIVYSTEKMGDGKAELLPLPEHEFQKGRVGDLGVLPDFRVRILPVLGTMPAVFGYAAANHVLLTVAGYPVDYASGKGREKMYESILAFLLASEEKLVRAMEADHDAAIGLKLPVTPGDVSFLVEELYRARSVVTGISTRLVLVRWRRPEASPLRSIGEGASEQRSSSLKLRDLVCMTRDEANTHVKHVLVANRELVDVYEQDVVDRVESRLKEAEAYERYR